MNNWKTTTLGILLASSVFAGVKPLFATEITNPSETFSPTKIAQNMISPSGFLGASFVSNVTYSGGIFVQSGNT